MRTSTDELAADGTILNGYDYRLQVWVKHGVVLNAGHPHLLGHCNACTYAGVPVLAVPGHEVREG